MFQVSFKAAKPVYRQLVDQVKAAAASGALRQGESLPSVRALAEELRVNRNTVAKAYAQLESEPSPLRKDARRRLLAGSIDELIVQAHHLQVTRAELLDLVRERFDALAARQSGREVQKQGTS
jgi:GntR family transcriptional regulator